MNFDVAIEDVYRVFGNKYLYLVKSGIYIKKLLSENNTNLPPHPVFWVMKQVLLEEEEKTRNRN